MNERISLCDKKTEVKSRNAVPQIRRKAESSQSMNTPVDRILFLQRTIGNQAVQRLIKSGALQAKLRIGRPGDIYEQEADRVAEQVMRIPDVSKGKDTGVQRKCPKCLNGLRGLLGKDKKDEKLQAKEAPGQAPEVTPQVEANINALKGGGQPLPESMRAFFEPRFGHNFSHVRVHTDAKAAESARTINALAYATGRDIFFATGLYDPISLKGRWILAHELTHVLQQGGRSILSGQNIEIGAAGGQEQQSNAVATAAVSSRQLASVTAGTTATIMLLTPEQFRTKLGATPDQKSAIDALFANAQFKALWDYTSTCPAKPAKDLGPLTLKVTPGLKIGGVERFGGYNPLTRTLEINPTKPEHQANPQELIDTVVHELIHAVDDLDEDCVKAGAPASPLAGAGTESSAPALADVKGTAEEDKLLRDLGPGASNPCEEFIDINKKAQQIIVTIIQSNIKTTKIGRPTLTFVNDALRNSPAALAEYKKCRDAACAKVDLAARQAEIGKCAEAIIAKYVNPPPVKAPTPAPAPGVFPPSPPPPKMPPKKQKKP